MYACEGHIPELAGDRVRLRRLTEDDAADMLRCWSDPDTRKFTELPAMHAAADAAALIAWLNAMSEEEDALRWGIELTGSGRVIGSWLGRTGGNSAASWLAIVREKAL